MSRRERDVIARIDRSSFADEKAHQSVHYVSGGGQVLSRDPGVTDVRQDGNAGLSTTNLGPNKGQFSRC